MSEWVVENVRFTLYNDKRKERLFVQKSNGDITVTSKQRGDDDAPDEKRGAKADPVAKEHVTEGAKVAAEKPASKRKPASERKPRAAEASAEAPAEPARSTSLEWRPIVDAGYDGFAAKSHGAELQVLKTSLNNWALYVFWERGVWTHLQCFSKLREAKEAAQERHDTGLPPRPKPKLTQEMIDSACPVPPQASAPQRAPRKPRGKKAEAAKKTDAATNDAPQPAEPPAPPAEPPAPPADAPTELTPEVRAELRNSFKDAIVDAFKQAE